MILILKNFVNMWPGYYFTLPHVVFVLTGHSIGGSRTRDHM